ncbi:MAG: putative LPS assembly protein LptD [Dysgonomonas sp.]
MRNFRYCIYIILTIILLSPIFGARSSTNVGRSNAIHNDSTLLPLTLKDSLGRDSLLLKTDSTSILQKKTPTDSLSNDTVKKKKDALDAPVDYAAKDSIIFTAGNWGYLYGDAEVNYTTIKLKSEKISMNMDSSIVHATYGLDSIGAEFGYPVFSDAGTDYEAKSMRYNFKTKKGYITNVITEQGEGYIVAERAKKNADDSFFMCNGKYTTCDQHDHPHFYLMLTKAKVRPKKNIVTGPAYLVIEDVPLPIALPFGFFPFTDKYSSGVIMPSYTDELERGFGLRDGGYYFAINDHVDLALTGEIHTKGSWGLAAKSEYRKRYRFSGNFYMNYLFTKYGDKEDPDYSEQKDFRISWRHTQDPKANMYRTLSADVNFSTSSYNRNNLNELYSGNTSNTKSSTVTMTQRFPNSPFTISGSVSATQISSDSTVSLTLPNLTVSMSRIYPFKKKDKVGADKWYEKIQLSYTADIKNSITTKEDKIFKSSLQKDWNNAIKHSIPVSATFNVFNYLNITPSFNYNERWYFKKIKQAWNGTALAPVDTIYSFNRVYDFNYSISFQTKLYGYYDPIFKIGKLQRIRHVFTPSVSFGGNPDFSDPKWGFYEKYYYYDSNGNIQEDVYSPYRDLIFGTAPSGKSGNINFSFDNNLEMKIGTDNDSTKIISLIDNLGIRFSYNMMADKYKWSDISTNVRLKLSKSLTVNVNATFDPYLYGLDDYGNPERLDKLRISRKLSFGRLKNTGYSISPSIDQDTFKKWFGKGGDTKSTTQNQNAEQSEALPLEGEEATEEGGERTSLLAKKKDTGEYDDDGYLKSEIKWSLSLNYSFQYGYNTARFDYLNKEYKYKLTHSLGLSGAIQPTKNWNFNFTTSYDFEQNKFAYVNCTLTRNLHCWSLSASFIPVGPYKSYFVSLRASSSMLQDLKYDKRGRSSSFDPEWY